MKISAKQVMNQLAQQSDVLKEVGENERLELQKTLLGMLSDIIRVCDNNNIRVALVGGSALGAVRHKGFIPWDDDIDLGMPRRDWEIFKKIFESTLGKKYILEAPNYGDKDCKNPWGKVYLKDTIFEEIQDINMPYCKGIFIDVFVWDNVSSNTIIRKIDAISSDFLKGVATSITMYKYPNELEKQFYSYSTESKRYYNLRRFLGFLFSWCSHKDYCDWYEKLISRHEDSSGLCTTPVGRKNYMGEIIEDSQWNLQEVDFGGIKAYIFNDINRYLVQLYGADYMCVPPVEKRERHFIVKLRFKQM